MIFYIETYAYALYKLSTPGDNYYNVIRTYIRNCVHMYVHTYVCMYTAHMFVCTYEYACNCTYVYYVHYNQNKDLIKHVPTIINLYQVPRYVRGTHNECGKVMSAAYKLSSHVR